MIEIGFPTLTYHTRGIAEQELPLNVDLMMMTCGESREGMEGMERKIS